MSRDSLVYSFPIAILATGDEICQGDILNSNAQYIANKLFIAGMNPKTQVSSPDQIKEIEKSMLFLLQDHAAMIVIGGLGPTSDDLTRYALSGVVAKPLQFFENSWQKIINRLKKYNLGFPPESNRKQALFPEGSEVISNSQGTADGCILKFDNKFIFLLPGPPNECLPMFENTVLPTLEHAGFSEKKFFEKWLLFDVSEGMIAEKIDNAAKDFKCVTGYRLNYPYLEVKLISAIKDDFLRAKTSIEKIIQPYLMSNGKETALDALINSLKNYSGKITIHDLATGGLLQSKITLPETYQKLIFTHQNPDILIQGLSDYWQQKTSTTTLLEITAKNYHVKVEIPLRGDKVKIYALEFLSFHILKILNSEYRQN